MTEELVESLRLGATIGRAQAFGLMANHSLAAQAKVLKGLRDSGDYESTGLSWDRFCPECLGLSRPRIDSVIDCYEEFGDAYVRVCEIIKLSPETYRGISSRIDGEAIEIDGEMVALDARNADRIRAAVQDMRNKLRQAKVRASKNPVEVTLTRLEGCVAKIALLSQNALEPADRNKIRGIVETSALRLMEILDRTAA